jgi:hypothetical protein
LPSGRALRQRSSIDVASHIDRHPVGAFQFRLLLICAAVRILAAGALRIGEGGSRRPTGT